LNKEVWDGALGESETLRRAEKEVVGAARDGDTAEFLEDKSRSLEDCKHREDCLLQSVSAVRRCLLVPSMIEKISAAVFTGRSSIPCRKKLFISMI
jgi:hypothetical protein